MLDTSIVKITRGMSLATRITRPFQTSTVTCLRIDRPPTPKYNLAKVSNKKISRLESDIELESEHHKSRVINRNPRNLEKLNFEKKPTGYWWDANMPSHYHKLVLEQSSKYISAYLIHWSGRRLVEASTREPKLLKYYNNPNTTQAATVLAQVMARRCLQSGYINTCADDLSFKESSGPKAKVFFESVQEHGISFDTSPEIEPRTVSDV